MLTTLLLPLALWTPALRGPAAPPRSPARASEERDAKELLGEARRHGEQRGVLAALAMQPLLPEEADGLARLAASTRSPHVQTAALAALVARMDRLDDDVVRILERSRVPEVHYEGLLEATRRIEDGARRAEAVEELASSRDELERLVGVELLATVDTPSRYALLTRALTDEDPRVRRKAVDVLERARTTPAVGVLVARLALAEPGQAFRIASALERVTGRDLGRSAGTWARWWEDEGKDLDPAQRPKDDGKGAPRAAAAPKDPQAAGGSRASFYGLPIHARSLVFAIDSSLSMKEPVARTDGTLRIDVAKDELSAALRGLDEEARFDIVDFGRDAPSWRGELVPATERNRKAALEHVADLRLTFGTEVYGALQASFVDPSADTILFLTDGDPYESPVVDRTAIRRLVAQWNRTRHTTIDCVSVGTDRPWLRRLAEESGGRYVRVD